MKKRLPVLLWLLCFHAAFSQTVYKNFVDGQLYVKFKSLALKPVLSEDPTAISAGRLPDVSKLAAGYGITKLSRPFYQADDDAVLPYILKIQFTKKQSVNALITDLMKTGSVEYAEKIPILKTDATPNDPVFPPHLSQINATNAWNIFNGNSNITVAIVDDAIMWTHADLIGNMYTNPGEIAGNNIDDDGNGYVDDVHGWDAADLDNDPIPTNLAMNHGTHCAGIAGARTDNATGVASIGWNIKIIPVKCQTNTGAVANISNGYEGIIYAAKAKARVISCSWGNGTYLATGQSVINYAWNRGCLIVAAAGNAGTTALNYPGAYNHVYCVASVESNDVKAGYSTYGNWVDIAAPGSNINSTVPYSGTPAYQQMSGTSMATPLVAGLAGLMLSKCPQMTATDVMNCISSTAVNIYTLSGNSAYAGQLGAGRIEAFQAMNCAAGFLNVAPVANFFAEPVTSCTGTPVQFYDSSLYTPTSWAWTFQGGTPATSTASNPVVQWAANGAYNVSLMVSNTHGSNTKTKQAYVNITSPGTLPFAEGFQATTFLPVNWTARNIMNDEIYWERKTGVGGFGTSNACAAFDNYNYNTVGDLDEMRTPKYDLSHIASVHLVFDVAYARYDFVTSDSLEVKLTTDCGTSWSTIYFKGGAGLATAPNTGAAFVPASSQWRRDSIDVTPMAAGQGNVMFSFINHGHYGQAIYLDNINLRLPAPALVVDIPDTACANTPVVFGNSSTGATSYQWNLSGSATTTTSIVSPTVSFNTSGDYTIGLTGVNGTSSATVIHSITIIDNPSAGFSVTPATCITCADGGIAATILTGESPFSYTWAPSGGNSNNAQNLTPGNYTLTIEGAGCVSVVYAQVGISTGIGSFAVANESLHVYPNPAKNNLNVELNGTFGYSLYDAIGRLVAQNKINTNAVAVNIEKLSKGMYVLEIKTDTELLRKKIIIE